ncbi:MAG: ABC transporter ATP-binding protein [Candidatus Lokiarchaeota archaeon]|nr:ABC transporter ATP-binding protein [Candidatus Lokiarchaeota archaeon]
MRKKKKNADALRNEEKYKVGTLKIVKRLIQYIGSGNKKLAYPLVIFTVINIIISWFTPLIFRLLVDDGLGGGIGAIEGDIDIVIFLGTLFFILTIIGVLTRIIQGYIISKLATLTMYNLRYELFVKFQKLGLDYHESPKRTTGKKINYLTGDINTIQQLIQSGLLISVSNIFLVFGALFFMILLSPILTIVSFLIVPLFFGISGFLLRKARKYFKELRERIATVTSTLDESIMGMRIIQSFAVEESNFKEFNEATELEKQTTMKTAKLMAYMPGIVIIIIALGISSVLFTSGILIREGTLTQGTLIAFVFYLFSFFEPLFSLMGFMTLLQNSLAAGSRIIRILDENISITEREDAVEIHNIKGEIEFANVNFSYIEDIPILKNIDLKINAKERLALVGYTGAGKSTFIKLLSRFYDPTEGEIKVDSFNLKDLQIKSLRNKLGIVLQDNFLFSGTIRENIRYGKLDATDDEIIKVAKNVRIHEYIMELKNGYETIVGERGSRLSEGQKQLIAFARALIADPPILILDEATSSIDPYSELLIQEALETLMKGRTSISIAHRLSTIINSDRIIVLDKGQIIEQGTHQELIERDGFYNHIYRMQFKDPFKKRKIDKIHS